jgi:hypothetical protein
MVRFRMDNKHGQIKLTPKQGFGGCFSPKLARRDSRPGQIRLDTLLHVCFYVTYVPTSTQLFEHYTNHFVLVMAMAVVRSLPSLSPTPSRTPLTMLRHICHSSFHLLRAAEALRQQLPLRLLRHKLGDCKSNKRLPGRWCCSNFQLPRGWRFALGGSGL